MAGNAGRRTGKAGLTPSGAAAARTRGGDPPTTPRASSDRRLLDLFQDWWKFLIGDVSDVFTPGQAFRDQCGRLLQLVAFSVFISAVFMGLPSIKANKITQGLYQFVLTSRPAMSVLFGGVLAGFAYSLVLARLYRIRLNAEQSVYTFVFLGVPWLPVIAFTSFVAHAQAGILVSPIVWLLRVLSVVAPTIRLANGIGRVATCSALRVWMSLAPAVLLFLAAFIAAMVIIPKH